ncbi:hypothetical protein CDL15_Pgr020244 [Punica granatum]|uniref:BHLH domain-containing protein n=1 Tax=Punica granatum TaxID=22663 RepID=A0A218VS93_PUNGR|nr:hypothetical protein CDL15_Pgr020244 [Punica granatum]
MYRERERTALLGYGGNELCCSMDDDWGFDQRTYEEEQGDTNNGCFGFPGNQAAGCFYGQWNCDELEFQLSNTSTSGSTPHAAAAAADYSQRLDQDESKAVIDSDCGPSRRRRVKGRGKKQQQQEDIENQRITHIAVERNRRKQMNEYLSVIRSLMPTSYAQRVSLSLCENFQTCPAFLKHKNL